MSDNIPTPDPDEVRRKLEDDRAAADETQPEGGEPATAPETPPGNETDGGSPASAVPEATSNGSGTLSVKLGVGVLFIGLTVIGLAAGLLVSSMGFGWQFAVAIGAGVILAAAGISGVVLALKRHLDEQHEAVMSAAGFGLPGLDPEQAARLNRQQALIDQVLSDLPEHQDRLETLDETIPTQAEQIRWVAESQRQIWEEIEEEYR